ncbi:MAG: hypothetical protein ACREEM_25365 [Blastocatellia bacterium]
MNHPKERDVFVAYNPLDADEFVWIDTDVDKIEALLVPKTSTYNKEDREKPINLREPITIIYLINKTPELEALYHRLSREEFENIDLRSLKQFDLWNCCVPRITMIAGWLGTKQIGSSR